MSGIETFLTNRLTWVSTAYVAIFIFFAWLEPTSTVAEASRASATALGLIGMVTFAEAAVRAYKAHRWPNPDLIASLGLFVFCTGVGTGGLFQILWRLSGFDTVIVNNDFYSFTVSLIAMGLFVLVATPNVIGRGVPKWTRVRIGAAWVVALALVVGLVTLSPDLRPLANLLRPYLAEAG